MNECKIEKSKYLREKIYLLDYPNIQKLRFYLVSNLNEKYNYFLPYSGFLWAKMGPKPKDEEVR